MILIMDAHIAELTRLIHNLIRFGTIAEVDGDRARIQSGQITTDWLRWFTTRAGNAVTWWQPSVGEQVMLFSPCGDLTAGIILPAIYSDQHPAPEATPSLHTTHYPDGAVVQYDSETHALAATLPDGGSATLTAPAVVTVNTQSATVNADTVTINAPATLCTGDLTVQGSITGQAGLAISPGAGGGPAARITGAVEIGGDATIGGKSFLGHAHREQGDGAPTSAPL